MERRTFMRKIGKSLLVGGIFPLSCHTTPNQEPLVKKSKSYATVEQFTEIFLSQGIKPIVQDNNGNRTLLEIGEAHSFTGHAAYEDFFRNLEERIVFDPIFLEGVYTSEEGELDPYLAIKRDYSEFFPEIPFDPKKLKEEDCLSYYRLSKKYRVRGVEEKDNLDVRLMGSIQRAIEDVSSSGIERSSGDIKKIYALASRLRRVQLSLPKNIDEQNIHSLREEIARKDVEVSFGQRNTYFINTIDQYLHPYATGALIIGKTHVLNKQFEKDCELIERSKLTPEDKRIFLIEAEERKKYGTIQEELARRKINTILITQEQVIEFNKKYG